MDREDTTYAVLLLFCSQKGFVCSKCSVVRPVVICSQLLSFGFPPCLSFPDYTYTKEKKAIEQRLGFYGIPRPCFSPFALRPLPFASHRITSHRLPSHSQHNCLHVRHQNHLTPRPHTQTHTHIHPTHHTALPRKRNENRRKKRKRKKSQISTQIKRTPTQVRSAE